MVDISLRKFAVGSVTVDSGGCLYSQREEVSSRLGGLLVLGDIPSLRELWSDAAIFVHPDDQSGLTRALRELVDK